jgi:hypothetical protein
MMAVFVVFVEIFELGIIQNQSTHMLSNYYFQFWFLDNK